MGNSHLLCVRNKKVWISAFGRSKHVRQGTFKDLFKVLLSKKPVELKNGLRVQRALLNFLKFYTERSVCPPPHFQHVFWVHGQKKHREKQQRLIDMAKVHRPILDSGLQQWQVDCLFCSASYKSTKSKSPGRQLDLARHKGTSIRPTTRLRFTSLHDSITYLNYNLIKDWNQTIQTIFQT